MPCRDDYTDDTPQRLDRATRAACSIIRLLRLHGAMDWDDCLRLLPKSTVEWVKEHDEADRERRAEAKEEREQRKLEKKALSKLNKKEREALGLPER